MEKRGKGIGLLPLRLNITQKTKPPVQQRETEASSWRRSLFGKEVSDGVRLFAGLVGEGRKDGVDAVGLGWLERVHVFMFIR